ncbi:MAG: hypothetical protein P8J86_05585 [Phycisphaerales bacterium]|nr:hypothetical protein [Phycisphaerales bacterium]
MAEKDGTGLHQGGSKITHSNPGLGSPDPAADIAPLPVAISEVPAGMKKIRTLESKKKHEEEWSRTPNTTGVGAIHVRTFHCKLSDDSLAFMDQNINEWLDAHPQYEVKFVTSSVGVLTGKLKEPHLICQVWV